jgi:hypothetical protein
MPVSRVSNAFGMPGLESGFPCSAGIRKLHLDAFHIKGDGSFAGKHKFDGAFRTFAGNRERHRQQIEHSLAISTIEAERAHGIHPLEQKHGTPALEGTSLAIGHLPDEPVDAERKLLAAGIVFRKP